MKKTLLIVAIAGLAMASCKKDRTCECTNVWTPTSGASVTTTETYTVKKATKGAAIDGMCQGYKSQVTAPVSGATNETTCELK